LGFWKISNMNKYKIIAGAKVSFNEKNGWNVILSLLFLVPVGLDDPLSCNVIIWIIIKLDKIKGSKKWSEKNRFKVAFLTENPPQIHWTISIPRNGIADSRLVITVAPQKDIWPHGKTYPINAVAIKIKIIDVPDNQVSFFLKEENRSPRLMWQ
jgi:hypothetical protein